MNVRHSGERKIWDPAGTTDSTTMSNELLSSVITVMVSLMIGAQNDLLA